MMRIQDLDHKNICILGFGREGKSVLRALEKYVPHCNVTIADAHDIDNEVFKIQNSKFKIQIQTGDTYLDNLDSFDIIIKSPGIPPSSKLNPLRQGYEGQEAQSSKLTNSTQIFLDTVQDLGSIVIGITGSKGKSTVTSLIYEILKNAGKDTHLVGNIGQASLNFLDDAQKGTIFVQEMSSYQLMDLTSSPPIAVITSFFPEHLDYHGSLEAYKDAKMHIARFQKSEDTVFYNRESDGATEIAMQSKGTKIPFSLDECPVSIADTNLQGTHNLSNIDAAYKVALHVGVEPEVAIRTICAFQGLPHRLQHLGTEHGIQWVDDAISTTPDSTIAAIHALEHHVDCLLVGGQDRGLDFSQLGSVIASSAIRTILVFPDTGEKIREAIAKSSEGSSKEIITVNSMPEAVAIAKEKTERGKICLLSPASPSYNQFLNFEEKGEAFEKAIRER